MIEIERSRSGQPYLKLNDHHLSSSVDPILEARKWTEHYRTHFENAQNLFLIGAGSGYHILELANQQPNKNIFVFEAESSVLEAVRNLHRFSSRVRLCMISGEGGYDLLVRPDDLRETTTVLKYLPSFHLHTSRYNDLILFLTGRHPRYLPFYSRVVGSYGALNSVQNVISVHDFERSIQGRTDLLSADDRIWLMLRELVK